MDYALDRFKQQVRAAIAATGQVPEGAVHLLTRAIEEGERHATA